MPRESVYYRLEVDLECTSRTKYSIIYCQGISPCMFRLKDVCSYRILKIFYDNQGECQTKNLERYLILFQRRWRQWRIFRSKLFKHVRLRVLGLSPSSFILSHLG
jgi:hypothetical protein